MSKEIAADLDREDKEIDQYLKARMEWDDRYGNARTQAESWRYATFISLGLLGLSLLGMAYLGSLPKRAVHVVQVDKLGHANYVGRAGVAGNKYSQTDAAKRYHLKRFIEDVRSLPSDRIVVKQRWQDAYKLVSPSAANILSEYARNYVPTERMKKERVTLGPGPITLIPISKDSWSAEWEETYWGLRGQNNGTKKWKAIFNLVYQEPKTESELRDNPIGMYIDSFNWTKVE